MVRAANFAVTNSDSGNLRMIIFESGGDGFDCPEVWARMAILNKQLKTAEEIYLEQNDIEKALKMYKSFHKWDDGNVEWRLSFS